MPICIFSVDSLLCLLVQYYRMIGNRRDDIGLLVAACDTYQDVHFVDTGTTAGIVEFMSDSFKSQWHKDMNTSHIELIPCMPLSAILAKFGVHQLDFWSLDVEGGEIQVSNALGTCFPPPPPQHTHTHTHTRMRASVHAGLQNLCLMMPMHPFRNALLWAESHS